MTGSVTFLLLLLSLMFSVTEANFNMDFTELELVEKDDQFDFKGESRFIHGNAVDLVCGHEVKRSYSYGGIIYKSPYNLFFIKENRTLSFSSEFVVDILVPSGNNPMELGNGFAFFLSPNDELAKTPFGSPYDSFSVAFDNRVDTSNPIPTDTYVTVFTNSLFPNLTSTMDFNLHVTQKIKVQVVYKAKEQNLLVFVHGFDNFYLPSSLVLNSSVDLTAYMLDHDKNSMFVGISAASNTCHETYKVDSWKLSVEKPEIRRRISSSLMITLIVVGTIVVGCVLLMLIARCRAWIIGLFAIGGSIGVGALANAFNNLDISHD